MESILGTRNVNQDVLKLSCVQVTIGLKKKGGGGVNIGEFYFDKK